MQIFLPIAEPLPLMVASVVLSHAGPPQENMFSLKIGHVAMFLAISLRGRAAVVMARSRIVCLNAAPRIRAELQRLGPWRTTPDHLRSNGFAQHGTSSTGSRLQMNPRTSSPLNMPRAYFFFLLLVSLGVMPYASLIGQ